MAINILDVKNVSNVQLPYRLGQKVILLKENGEIHTLQFKDKEAADRYFKELQK